MTGYNYDTNSMVLSACSPRNANDHFLFFLEDMMKQHALEVLDFEKPDMEKSLFSLLPLPIVTQILLEGELPNNVPNHFIVSRLVYHRENHNFRTVLLGSGRVEFCTCETLFKLSKTKHRWFMPVPCYGCDRIFNPACLLITSVDVAPSSSVLECFLTRDRERYPKFASEKKTFHLCEVCRSIDDKRSFIKLDRRCTEHARLLGPHDTYRDVPCQGCLQELFPLDEDDSDFGRRHSLRSIQRYGFYDGKDEKTVNERLTNYIHRLSDFDLLLILEKTEDFSRKWWSASDISKKRALFRAKLLENAKRKSAGENIDLTITLDDLCPPENDYNMYAATLLDTLIEQHGLEALQRAKSFKSETEPLLMTPEKTE